MTKFFFASWGGAFGDAWRFARALPWLIALMIALEMAQHFIEMRIGFFSPDAAVRHAAGLQPIRMALGWPKMFAVWGLAFFATRYFVLGDARATLRPSPRALRRYAGVVLFQLIPAVLVVYAEPVVAWFGFVPDPKSGAVLGLRVVCGLGQQLLEPALLFWFVNAALGTSGFGPLASARVTRWLYLWALLLVFVTRLPFNALHQLLNRWPSGQGPMTLWPLLALDALVVSVMVVTIAAVEVRAARVIAARRGVALLAGV